MYVEYLKDFWYTVEVDDANKDISFSLSLFENQLSFTHFDFLTAIGLTDSKSVVPLPPKGTVRAGLATLGLATQKTKPSLTSLRYISLVLEQLLGENYHDESLTILKPHHISAASFQTPSASEVSLTSHMLKVAKLSKEPDESLILPSEEVNAEATADKSQSGTNMHHSQTSLEESGEVKGHPQPTRVSDSVAEEQSLEILTVAQLLDEVNKAAQETLESPYDIKSEIKVVKSFFTSHLSGVQDQIMNDYEESAGIQEDSDSDLQSMPDDDLRSVSGFEVVDSDDIHDNEVSYSAHTSQDDIASAEHLSIPDHLDHIFEEVNYLHSRLRNMESSIVQTVSDEIKSSLPTIITNALKEQLPVVLSATLKDCLPLIVNESLQIHNPAVSEQFAETQVERISKKRTKNEAKTTKSDTEWKSMLGFEDKEGLLNVLPCLIDIFRSDDLCSDLLVSKSQDSSLWDEFWLLDHIAALFVVQWIGKGRSSIM
ncbi:hypothetical protein Tco_0489866 [Tanacetum coccineum]